MPNFFTMHTRKGLAPVLWVIIAAIVLGGGYLLVKKLRVESFKEEVKGEQTAEPGTENGVQSKTAVPADLSRGEALRDGKTYRNEKYGFLFRYPAGFTLKEGEMDTGSGLGKWVQVQFGAIPNVISAIIDVNAGVHASTNCSVPVNGPTYTKTVAINGVQFYTGQSGDQGMGMAQQIVGYSTIRAGQCTQINLVIEYGRNADNSYTPQFDRSKIEQSFNEILSTFRFTK